MNTQFGMSTVEADSPGEADEDLYRLYVQFLTDAQAEVGRRTPPGRERDAQLRYCEPLPREHFEAKIEAVRERPAEFGGLVHHLRGGYRP